MTLAGPDRTDRAEDDEGRDGMPDQPWVVNITDVLGVSGGPGVELGGDGGSRRRRGRGVGGGSGTADGAADGDDSDDVTGLMLPPPEEPKRASHRAEAFQKVEGRR